MTDRELLELAAKAAGIENLATKGDTIIYTDEDGFSAVWNPLLDDGDALRLAVKLRLEPRPYVRDGFAECNGQYELHDHGNVQCVYAAMRGAIVRAAAEIGRSISACTNGCGAERRGKK